MRIEVKFAADFLVDLLRLNSSGLTDDQLEKFKENVSEILMRHYADHWFPDRPFKGSGYRCIRINGNLDPLIARAGFMMGLASCFLRSLFPSELTMWIDPMEVAYRIGENGSICVLYEETPPSTPPPSTPPQQSQNTDRTPVKTSPPPPQSPPSPPFNHFSPSKSMVVSPIHQSPPMSPITTNHHHHHHHHHQAASNTMQLSAMFGATLKCKESLRNGLDARALHMDRLFVSS